MTLTRPAMSHVDRTTPIDHPAGVSLEADMKSSSRWVGVGAAVLGVGALLTISWLVYVSQSHSSYWSWEGTLGVVLSGIGAVMLVIGFVMPGDETPVHMVQRGGPSSVNIQASRDVNFRGDKIGD